MHSPPSPPFRPLAWFAIFLSFSSVLFRPYLSTPCLTFGWRASLLYLVLADPTSTRLPSLDSLFRAHLPVPGLRIDYRYLDASDANNTDHHHLAIDPQFRALVDASCGLACSQPRDLAMIARDFFAMRFHALESDCAWMVRVTDDTMLNFDIIAAYIDGLNREFDPLVDSVVRADCVAYYSDLYPQGGSGVLFSRAASRMLMDDFARLHILFAQAEDIAFGAFLTAKGVNMREMADPHFLGLGWKTTEVLEEDLAAAQIGCPPVDNNRTDCGMVFVAPLRDVVFYHHQGGRAMNVDAIAVSRAVFNISRNVMWYARGDSWPRLCIHREGNGD
jgi:hypothetical protein